MAARTRRSHLGALHFLGMLFLVMSHSKIIVRAQQVTVNNATATNGTSATAVPPGATAEDERNATRLGAALSDIVQALRGNSTEAPTGRMFSGLGANPGAFSGLGGGLFRQGNSGFGSLLGGLLPSQPFGNLNDLASQLPTPSDIIGFLRDPVAALAPEPLAPEYQDLLRSDNPEAIATIAFLSAIFNLVSSILYIVSGALGTTASSLALVPASLALVTGPIGFELSALAFGQTLASDFSTNSEGYYEKWVGSLTNLADKLQAVNNGTMAATVKGQRARLANVRDMLSVAINLNGTRA